jgi:hypothetical protein
MELYVVKKNEKLIYFFLEENFDKISFKWLNK